jgi:hypothetical protein
MFIDPKSPNSIDLDKFDSWNEFCSTNATLKTIKWKQYQTNIESKQTDSYSCGLFVCHYFKMIIENNLSELANPNKNFDIKIYRKIIPNAFFQNNKFKRVCCSCGSSCVKAGSVTFQCGHLFHQKCFQQDKCYCLIETELNKITI